MPWAEGDFRLLGTATMPVSMQTEVGRCGTGKGPTLSQHAPRFQGQHPKTRSDRAGPRRSEEPSNAPRTSRPTEPGSGMAMVIVPDRWAKGIGPALSENMVFGPVMSRRVNVSPG